MVVQGTDKKYKAFIKRKDQPWGFGNSILYRMCEENPKHNKEDVIIGKIWIIGRSYAAAIERRKNADEYSGDDFYFDAVAPKMIAIGKELDHRIDKLRASSEDIAEDVRLILSTHKFLMDSFYEITGLEKRSLASKYLHFHCPEKFFIYDSRARNAIGKIVKRPNKLILSDVDDYDEEYGDFVCRMIELQEYLKEKVGTVENPRDLDSFLLAGVS